MNSKAIVLAMLAASVLLVGAAGAVTAQPADDEDGQVGPPGGLPDVVPDFVSDILSSISDFVFGSISDLGSAVSGTATGN